MPNHASTHGSPTSQLSVRVQFGPVAAWKKVVSAEERSEGGSDGDEGEDRPLEDVRVRLPPESGRIQLCQGGDRGHGFLQTHNEGEEKLLAALSILMIQV